MIYWIIIIILLPFIFILISHLKSKAQQKKKLTEIKERWGKPIIASRNFKPISTYLTAYGSVSEISANTATDLDIDSVFEFIDRTNSKPGQQYLYKQLHSPQISEEYFETLEQRIGNVTADKELREAAELKLSELGNNDAYYLPELFKKPHHSMFPAIGNFYISIAPFLIIGVAFSLFIVPNQFMLLLLLVLMIANVVIHYSNKTQMLNYTHSLPQLLVLFKVSNWLKNHALLRDNESTRLSMANMGKLKNSLNYITLQNKAAIDPTDIYYLVTEWLKMFLLIEPLVFIKSITKVNKYLSDIKVVYEAVAEVDVAISIQSVRDGAAHYCKPQLTTGNTHIIIKNLYHPLIENCVSNSIAIDNTQGILVTGSNMSGKTTFIRAIAINALLSQTINTSFATVYQAPPLKIFTSIDMTDDLGDNKSYFQAEALAVKNIVAQTIASKPINSLVIIDEIFRGTNTIERIAAAKAVLSYFIHNQSFVFVSTHDLELAELLGSDYKVFSFEEVIGDDRLVFDYKIKEGLLKNRNGIAVLKGVGFPESIIDEANKVSSQLREKYNLKLPL
ncbi:DNA mismatch repair ATPase MutS [Mucilaginibacter rubeus]|uniref:MutS-related protein n=1 Tax=Mucilaginibacter rubeus TaxID=2027860 RepID=UPI003391426C